MVICTVIILALLIIAMAAISANLADLENRIQTLMEGYADLSRLVPLLQARVEELGMLVQLVGALENKEDDEVDKHLARE